MKLPTAAFAIFCLLSASAWLLADPNPAPAPLTAQTILYPAIALLALVPAIARSHRTPPTHLLQLIPPSLALITAPALLLRQAAAHLSPSTLTALLTLIPLVLVLARSTSNPGARQLLLPATTALGGALFLIPFEIPTTTTAIPNLAAVFAATALITWASLNLHRQLQTLPFAPSLATFAGANALALLALSLTLEHPALTTLTRPLRNPTANLLQAAQIPLLLYLLRALPPLRLSTRFLFIPLLTALEGALLLRPTLTARTVLGALTLLASSLILFRADELADTTLSLRPPSTPTHP